MDIRTTKDRSLGNRFHIFSEAQRSGLPLLRLRLSSTKPRRLRIPLPDFRDHLRFLGLLLTRPSPPLAT